MKHENIPLKNDDNGNGKKYQWQCCSEDCLGDLPCIIGALSLLTAVITIAFVLQIYYGDYQVTPHGSVATDSYECSQIGTAILKRGGNAIDAAIAAAFCLAVVTPHATSLDAVGQLLVYDHRNQQLPLAITLNIDGKDNLPRLVNNLAAVHKKFGGLLHWQDLINPAATLARDGFLVNRVLAIAANMNPAVFGNLEAGQRLQLHTLADTLEKFANLNINDLNHEVFATKAEKIPFFNYNVYVSTTSKPFGIFQELIQNAIDLSASNTSGITPEFNVELANSSLSTFKSANWINEFHPSSTLAVIDKNDQYVALVTGLHQYFGSSTMSPSGYVINDSPNDQLTYLPIIVTNKNLICGRRTVFGAQNLIVAIQLLTNYIVGGYNATQTIESHRFYLLNNENFVVEKQTGNNNGILSKILALPNTYKATPPYPSSNMVEKFQDDIRSHSDSRGGGVASRF